VTVGEHGSRCCCGTAGLTSLRRVHRRALVVPILIPNVHLAAPTDRTQPNPLAFLKDTRTVFTITCRYTAGEPSNLPDLYFGPNGINLGGLLAWEFCLMHWVEVRRWQDYKKPGSVNEVCNGDAFVGCRSNCQPLCEHLCAAASSSPASHMCSVAPWPHWFRRAHTRFNLRL